MADVQSISTDIILFSAVILFGTAVFGVVFDVSAGPYGSILVATVVSGGAVIGLVIAALGHRERITWIDPALARAGGLSWLGASIVLANPLPGTPLPFGQVALIGVIGCIVGGLMIFVGAVDRDEMAKQLA